jgi:hypothetical protein
MATRLPRAPEAAIPKLAEFLAAFEVRGAQVL